MTQRLIETWLPIAALGEESIRERRSMTALPPVYYLHVWWARRPLVASRAAILASLLPADADRDRFMHALGIHGDPIAAKKRIADADRKGERLGADAYGYSRAFSYTPDAAERAWLQAEWHRIDPGAPVVLDPTAGGGSIPFESTRLGIATFANDLNPVAALILRATIEWPATLGYDLLDEFRALGVDFVTRVRERLQGVFPDEPDPQTRPDGYLWARTITCSYCDGVIPLSPNWRLAPDGTGVRLHPDPSRKRCSFEIVKSATEHSESTVTGGDAKCPYPGCGRIVDGDEVKRQAQAGGLGEQLYTVVFKRRIVTKTQAGKNKVKWELDYRAPRQEDDNLEFIKQELEQKLPQWEADGIIPTEAIADPTNYERGHRMYGMTRWRDVFSTRQLLCHGTAAELIVELGRRHGTSEVSRSALAYLSLAADKMLNYNSRMSVWMSIREVVANTFNKHGFGICWSYAEMAPLIVGLGFRLAGSD